MFIKHIYLLVWLNLLISFVTARAGDTEHKQHDKSRATSPVSNASSDTSTGSAFKGHSIRSDEAVCAHRLHSGHSSGNLSINSFLALDMTAGAGAGERLSGSPRSSLTSARSASPSRLPVYDPATHKLVLLGHDIYNPDEHALAPKHHTKRPVTFGFLVRDFSHETASGYVARSDSAIQRSKDVSVRHNVYEACTCDVLPSLAKPDFNGELADEIAAVGKRITGFDRHDARQTSVMGYILGLKRVQTIPVFDKAVRESQAGPLAFRVWPGEDRRLVGPVVTSARQLCGIGANLAGNGFFQAGCGVALVATFKKYLDNKS